MITLKDFYNVLENVIPLYVAMILAYGSVKWWKIITPEQCLGINKFVSFFAVPFFSFKIISNNNPYAMNWRFILADTLQKLIILFVLFLWCKLSSRSSLEWSITLFSLSTLPNTLVMGVPLLTGMYGEISGPLMVQIVVMQSMVWNTILLILFEYRAGRLLIVERFSKNADSIRSFKVDRDVESLDNRDQSLESEVEIREDGKINVMLRKSTSVKSRNSLDMNDVEIYSLSSSKIGSSFDEINSFYNLINGRSTLRSLSVGNSRFNEGSGREDVYWVSPHGSKSLKGVQEGDGGEKDHISINIKCSSVSESPHIMKDCEHDGRNGSSGYGPKEMESPMLLSLFSSRSSTIVPLEPIIAEQCEPKSIIMPPTSVLAKLILMTVWRKLIRNPNNYASVFGLIWSLISYRFHIKMPTIATNSYKIISDTGLGMVMFSLGLFMGLQPQIIAGGYKMATYGALVRFIVGPGVTAMASSIVGLRGNILRISIVQASLPVGIIPFVFAKQFDIHPEILSTAVIFGSLIALPITLAYNIVLGLYKTL